MVKLKLNSTRSVSENCLKSSKVDVRHGYGGNTERATRKFGNRTKKHALLTRQVENEYCTIQYVTWTQCFAASMAVWQYRLCVASLIQLDRK